MKRLFIETPSIIHATSCSHSSRITYTMQENCLEYVYLAKDKRFFVFILCCHTPGQCPPPLSFSRNSCPVPLRHASRSCHHLYLNMPRRHLPSLGTHCIETLALRSSFMHLMWPAQFIFSMAALLPTTTVPVLKYAYGNVNTVH